MVLFYSCHPPCPQKCLQDSSDSHCSSVRSFEWVLLLHRTDGKLNHREAKWSKFKWCELVVLNFVTFSFMEGDNATLVYRKEKRRVFNVKNYKGWIELITCGCLKKSLRGRIMLLITHIQTYTHMHTNIATRGYKHDKQKPMTVLSHSQDIPRSSFSEGIPWREV